MYDTNARGENPNLHKTSNLDFAISRFRLIPESRFNEFAHHQSSQGENISIPLLDFKGINSESITGLENLHQNSDIGASDCLNEYEVKPNSIDEQTAISEAKIRRIKRQTKLIDSLTSKIEKNLFMDPLSVEQKSREDLEKLRLHVLKEDQEIYHEIIFGGNELDFKSQKSQDPVKEIFNKISIKQQNKDLFSFISEDDIKTPTRPVQYYNESSNESNNTKENENKEIKYLSVFFPLFTKPKDFYKFDDTVQTLFIDHSKNFLSIRIVIDYENHLSILSMLRFLLLINSCNILTLVFADEGSYSTTQNGDNKLDQLKQVGIILERIFFAVLSIRNLQSLTIQMNNILLPQFCAGINLITDPSKLSLRYFYLNGALQNANPADIAECIQFFSRIPSLYAFQSDTIVLSGKKSEEQFHKLLQNIQSIQLRLKEIPRDFSFSLPLSNLIKFDFSLVFESMQFNENHLDTLLSSIRSAKNLVVFRLHIRNSVTSRLEILNDAQKEKQSEEQNTNQSSAGQGSTSYPLFEHLIDLPNLKQLSFNCDISESVYDSLLKLLQGNINILEMKLYLKNPLTIRLNYRNIFQILNDHQNLKDFQLIVQKSISIVYRLRSRMSTSYYFSCEDRTYFDCLTKNPSNFNPSYFRFNRVSSIKLKLNLSSFQEIENIFESIENTPKLVSIELSAAPRSLLCKELPQNPICNPKFTFFNRLENLQNLKHLDLNSFVNQQFLDSLESFIRKSTTLKSLFFKRFQSNQFYLNYSGVFSAISTSKSIEQILFSSQIEDIKVSLQANIKKWEEVKLMNFYQPFADLYRNASSQLIIVEIYERNFYDTGLNVLLEGILTSSHQIYTRFTSDQSVLFQQISNDLTKALIDQACIAGHLVNPSYDFPFFKTPVYNNHYWF